MRRFLQEPASVVHAFLQPRCASLGVHVTHRRALAVLPARILVNVVAIGVSANAATVAHWRLQDQPSGTVASGNGTILDSGNGAHHGSPIGGPVYQADPGLGCSIGLDFDGTDDRISIPDHADFQLTQSLTLEAFVIIDRIPPTNQFGPLILFRGDDRGGLDPYLLALTLQGAPYFRVENASGNQSNLTVATPVPFDTLVHIAGTLDHATGQQKLFVNGIEVASTITAIRPYAALTGANPGLAIGNLQTGSTQSFFEGIIDEVRISDTALSPTQFLSIPGLCGGIPAVSEWGLLALALSTLVGGTLVLRRNRRISLLMSTLAVMILSWPRPLTASPIQPGDLLVTGSANNGVLRYNGQTGAFIEEFIPGNAGMGRPTAFAFGSDGSLFVAGTQVDNVTRFDGQTGAFVEEFVPSAFFSPNGVDTPFGLAFGPDGNLYVAGHFFHGIRRYDGQTGAYIDDFVPSGSGGLQQPIKFLFAPDGKLYVTSAATGEVLRYDGTTGIFIDAFVLPGSGGLVSPAGIAIGPDGHLYVGDTTTSRILRYDGQTGSFIDVFAGDPNGLGAPYAITFGPDGNLYVGQTWVQRFNGQTGAFIDDFVPFESGGLRGAVDLAFRPDGRLYVISSETHNVLRFNPTTGAFIDEFVHAKLVNPNAMTYGPDGHLYVLNNYTNNVQRFNGRTGAFMDEFVARGGGGLSCPSDLQFGPDGALYLVSSCGGAILRYDGQTGIFTDEFVAFGALCEPWGLTFGPDGDLYATDACDNSVLRFDGQSGALVGTFVSSGGGGLSCPRRLDFGPAGDLYVESFCTDNVLRFDGQTGAFVADFFPSGQVGGPMRTVFHSDGRAYTVGHGSQSVVRHDASSGVFVDTFVAPGSGGLRFPIDVTLAPANPGNVPAVSTWGLVIFAIGTLTAGTVLTSRRTGQAATSH